MFWTITQPLEITCWLVGAAFFAATVYAIWSKSLTWKFVCLLLAILPLAFIPSCIGVQYVLDEFRFGLFHHSNFDEVRDFRIERYLPPAARNIDLFKNYGGNGFRAKYQISHDELMKYLDETWEQWGERSAISRSDLARPDQSFADLELREFSDLGWALQGEVEILRSPVEADGGGATYYHDPKTGSTLQRAVYW